MKKILFALMLGFAAVAVTAATNTVIEIRGNHIGPVYLTDPGNTTPNASTQFKNKIGEGLYVRCEAGDDWGDLTFSFMVDADGTYHFIPRGQNLTAPDGTRTPRWTDFKSMQVNGVEYMKQPQTTSDAKSRDYKINLKGGEEYKVKLIARRTPAEDAEKAMAAAKAARAKRQQK